MYNGPNMNKSEDNFYHGKLKFNDQIIYLNKEIFLIGRNKASNLVINVKNIKYNFKIASERF
jgi:hypothetical protein